jgi:hypothetical protein
VLELQLEEIRLRLRQTTQSPDGVDNLVEENVLHGGARLQLFFQFCDEDIEGGFVFGFETDVMGAQSVLQCVLAGAFLSSLCARTGGFLCIATICCKTAGTDPRSGDRGY